MSKKKHYRSKEEILRDNRLKNHPEEQIIEVKGKKIKIGRVFSTAYYLRKCLIFLLCIMIITGIAVVGLGIFTNTWTSDIKGIGFSTLVSVVLFIGVLKNKRLLELANKYKKGGKF